MRIVHYCQHVLGMGHFFRSLEIDKALEGHEVTLVTGGTPVDIELPKHVRHEMLPPLMMDADFSRFVCMGGCDENIDPEEVLKQIRLERAAKLANLLEEIKPNVFLVELFPFGRKQFGFELLPDVLERGRSGDFGPMRSVCSLRDILVEKNDQAKFEERVLSVLNPLFHGLLVHTDPEVVTLNETFSRVDDIAIPVLNTGYISPLPEKGAGASKRTELGVANGTPLIVASAGSGSVGYDLLKATIPASIELAKTHPHKLQVYTGPFMDQVQQNLLKRDAEGQEHISINEFSNAFVDVLSAADLSISMAGYNTTMNLLAAKTFGLVLPFDQNREQRMRSERLARQGALGVLEGEELAPEKLAKRMKQALAKKTTSHGVDLNGAAKSAALLEQYFSPNGD